MVFEEMLENNLMMRTIKNEEDIVKFTELSMKFNNALEGATCNLLLREHKAMTQEDFFVVEDRSTGEFLATICLIPWEVNFEGVTLQAAMLEMVLCHPKYRKMGLVKKLIHRFLSEVELRGYDISIITGIPFYYRQYGYSYGVDLGSNETLPAFKLQRVFDDDEKVYGLRKAEQKDVPDLVRCYKKNLQNKQVAILRSEQHWKYLLEIAKYDIRLVEDISTKEVLGYFMLKETDDKRIIHIYEAELPNDKVAHAMLNLLKNDDTMEISIGTYEKDILAKLAKNLGSQPSRNTQWLLKTHDHVKFLNTIATVLERRLENGGYQSITTDVIVNLFQFAIKISIQKGKIETIHNIGFVDFSMGADGGDLCIPNDAFTRLLFGYRSMEELWDAWPDIVIKPEKKQILEALFPKLHVHFYAPYHYQG